MITEAEDYKQQDREEAESRRRERIRSRGPNIGEPCGVCEGKGFIVGVLPSEPPCPRCHGTRVQR